MRRHERTRAKKTVGELLVWCLFICFHICGVGLSCDRFELRDQPLFDPSSENQAEIARLDRETHRCLAQKVFRIHVSRVLLLAKTDTVLQ